MAALFSHQVPTVAGTASGIGTVVLNTAETQITVNLTFAGLSSNANAAHIHGPGESRRDRGVVGLPLRLPARNAGVPAG